MSKATGYRSLSLIALLRKETRRPGKVDVGFSSNMEGDPFVLTVEMIMILMS